jgi:hypothetical protein
MAESGLNPGHPKFLGALQHAKATLWNNLADDVQDDYDEAAKDWTAETPPSHIQSR